MAVGLIIDYGTWEERVNSQTVMEHVTWKYVFKDIVSKLKYFVEETDSIRKVGGVVEKYNKYLESLGLELGSSKNSIFLVGRVVNNRKQLSPFNRSIFWNICQREQY